MDVLIACNFTEKTEVNYLKNVSNSFNSDPACGCTPALYASLKIMLPQCLTMR